MKRRELFRKSMLAGVGLALGAKLEAAPAAGAPPAGERIYSRLNAGGKTELALSPEGPWTAVEPGGVFAGYQVASVPAPNGGHSWAVLERDDSGAGELVYVNQSGPLCRIGKPYGKVGSQVFRASKSQPREYWDKLLNAEDDILGKEYLADPRDPSLARTREALPPLLYPESYVGMKEYPHEVPVCWNGSIGIDQGFFAGNEPEGTGQLAAALPFTLNGKEIEHSEGVQVFRGQLDGYLPIIQYVYQRSVQNIGWEELVLMGRQGGKPALFLRFRIVNYSAEAKPVEFAVRAPLGGNLQPGAEQASLSVAAPSYAHTGAVLPGQPVLAVMGCAEPFEFEGDVARWRVQLPAGAHKDLYFILPGHSAPATVAVDRRAIRDSFYEALLGEYTAWQRFFSRGAQFEIPEPMVNTICKGALAKCLVCVDGSEPRGGAVWYEGFWPFCFIYLSQVLLEFGYYPEVRKYIAQFAGTRIQPTGRFRMGRVEANFQIFDTGDFLKLLANYYWYTRDATLIEEHKPKIDQVVNFIKQSRQESMRRYPENDPRYGMVLGIMNNDWYRDPPGYFYTNDAPMWQGLRDYAEALQAAGAARDRNEYVAEGQSLASYSKDYFATLRKSFATAIDRVDGRIVFVHIHPVLNSPARPLQCVYQTDMRHRAHRRFHEWPRLVGTDLPTDEERRAIFDYEFEHEQTVLGVRRFVPAILDNFQMYNSSFQKLRLGMVREYLMEYYGTIQALVGPGLWSGFEQVQVIPMDGEAGRRNGYGKYLAGPEMYGYEGAHATWPIPRATRQIFAFDEPDGTAVWVGRGIPRHWLAGGQPVAAKGVPTRYGKLDLRYLYQRNTRTLTISIDPLERRPIPEIRVGARAPSGGHPRSIESNPPLHGARVDAESDLVILRQVERPVSMRIRFD